MRNFVSFMAFIVFAVSTFGQAVNDSALIALAKAPMGSFQYSEMTTSARMSANVQFHSDHRFYLNSASDFIYSVGEFTETQIEWSKGRNSVLFSSTRTPGKALFNGARDWVEQEILGADDFRAQEELNILPVGNWVRRNGEYRTISDSSPMFKLKVSRKFKDNFTLGLTLPAFGANTRAGNDFVLEASYFERIELSEHTILDVGGSVQSQLRSRLLEGLGYETKHLAGDAHVLFRERIDSKARFVFGGSWSSAVTNDTGLPSDYDMFYINLGFDIGRFNVLLSENIEPGIAFGRVEDYSGLQKGADFTVKFGYSWDI